MRLGLLASSLGFWWFANVRVAHPMLGMPLFELFHDVQYLAIVWAFNRRRATVAGPELHPLLRAIFRPSAVSLVVYVALVAAYGALGLVPLSGTLGDAWGGLLAASQLLHFYYDGFIWKVRDPALAAPLGVTAPSRFQPSRFAIGSCGRRWRVAVVSRRGRGARRTFPPRAHSRAGAARSPTTASTISMRRRFTGRAVSARRRSTDFAARSRSIPTTRLRETISRCR